jgi:hypothetical protein
MRKTLWVAVLAFTVGATANAYVAAPDHGGRGSSERSTSRSHKSSSKPKSKPRGEHYQSFPKNRPAPQKAGPPSKDFKTFDFPKNVEVKTPPRKK